MKNTVTLLLFIGISIALPACGTTSILLVNLKTNDLRTCPVGEESEACIKRLEALGYSRADRLTPAEKASLGVSLPY
jgi:hypothetical protein